MSPPPPSSLASIKWANPGSPGKMAIKMEREREGGGDGDRQTDSTSCCTSSEELCVTVVLLHSGDVFD